MGTVAYDVTIGSARASSTSGKGTEQLLSLTSELTMDGAGGRCSLEIAASGASLPKPGDATSIKLDDGSESATVFTGEALEVGGSATAYVVVGIDGLSKLASLDVEGTYENATAGSIVGELIQAAGLKAGRVEDGPTFSRFVLHRGPRALRHLQRLAEACGFDLFTDGEGAVHFEPPRTGRADHSFKHGEVVLEMSLRALSPAYDGVVVWGEGAASSMGSAKDHWLVGDLAPVSGKASVDASFTVMLGSEGKTPILVKDGAVRTGADAADQAEARMKAVASRKLRGYIAILGNPRIGPGDLVAIDGVPEGHAASELLQGNVLRVRRVRHTLSPKRGFVTRMEF